MLSGDTWGMSARTPGARIKSARSQTEYSQTELGQLAGISQSRLSALENERRPPSADEWQRLARWLPLGPLDSPSTLSLPLPRSIWRVRQKELSAFGQCPPSVRELAAKKSFGQVAVQRQAEAERLHDPALVARFLSEAGLDSGHEHRMWVDLMAEGGKPCWFRPLKAGFDRLCVVDRDTRRNASDRRLACLDAAGPNTDWLLWPQVTLDARQAYYRLDALAKVCMGDLSLWLDLEIDGEGHDSQFDQRRSLHLGLPTLRLLRAELCRPNVLALLESRASVLFERRKAS